MYLFLKFNKARISVFCLAMFSCFYGYAQLPVTGGIKLRLDAASGFNDNGPNPATWADLSPAANTMLSGTGLNEPVHVANVANTGFPGVLFDGIDDYMLNQTLNNSMKDSEATMFVVRISQNVGAGLGGVNYTSMVSIAEDSTFLNEMGIGGDWALHHSSNGNSQARSHPCFDSVPTDRPVILSTVLGAQPDDIQYQIFGTHTPYVSAPIGTPVPYPNTPLNKRIVLGARFAADVKSNFLTDYFNGYLLEVLVYNRKLSPVELDAVNNYLKAKYYGAAPLVGTLTGNDVCDGETVYLTYTVPGGPANVTVKYTDGTGVFQKPVQNGVPFQMSPNITQTTTFTTIVDPILDVCSYNVPGGPTSTVTINVFPGASADAGKDTLVCPNDTIQLNGTGNGSFYWFPNDSMNDATLPNPTVKITQPTIFRLAVTNSSGCSDTAQVSVGFRTSAFSVFPKTATTICKGDSVQLFAYGGHTFTWTPNIGISDTSTFNPVVAPPEDMTYYVSIIQGECAFAATIPISIKVNPRPVAAATQMNEIGCDKVVAQLGASGGGTYYWYPVGELNDPTSANPVAKPAKKTTYTVSVTNEFGCTDTASVEVDAADGKRMIVLANAFSPNGDGRNDCYEVKIPFPVLSYEFNIFNRWGNKVFHTTNLNDCWNGQYNGKMQDMGTFYYNYRIKSNVCGEMNGEGSIHLVK